MSLRVTTVLSIALTAVLSQAALGQSEPALQERIDALALQIELRVRHEPTKLQPLRESVQAVLSEWNAATSGGAEATDEDRSLLNGWLDVAFRRIMPGGSGRLPAGPVFAGPARRPVSVPAGPLPSPGSIGRAVPRLAPPALVEPIGPIEERTIQTRVAETEPPRSRSRFVGPRHGKQSRTPPPTSRSVAKPIVRAANPTPAAPPSPRSSKWSRHPAAAPLEWRDPFADDRAASPNPLRSGTRREARRPTFPAAATTAVNLTQLTAEVRGYNAALRDLQARVMRLDQTDVFGLSDSADDLERLEEKRHFLDLYRQGLSASERRRLPDSPSSELIRELVRRRASELIRETPPERQAERRALRRLNDRLARFGRQASASF